MIKHGSGMALFLRYLTNKVSSSATLIIRRSHVPVCSEHVTNHSFSSPQTPKGLEGIFIASSSSPFYQASPGDLKNHRKVLTLKCDSDVIRYISYLIFETDDNRNVQPRQYRDYCQCSDRVLGVPYEGTPDDFKQNICDLNYYSLPHESRRHQESIFNQSGVDIQKSSSENGVEDRTLQKSKTNSTSEDSFKPPSEDQLAHVHQTLANDLPNFFTKNLNMSIYHPNIVLEDNIRGKRFVGILEYRLQSKLLYIIGHLRYMSIKFDVMKITSHPEDGTVKVRWKISILRLRKLLRIRPNNFLKSLQESNETWIDGFSTYYVMGDGLVHKHIADKLIPDPHQILKKADATKAIPVPNPLAYSNRN